MGETDQEILGVFMRSLSDEKKRNIPLTALYVKDLSPGLVKVDKSKEHHTEKLPCYWFYKPVSQLYKTFENE
ncbi:hypothetical protein [Mucilaginibacter sp. CSA2-8R]|uniref:hypothetical protein n=1 Tax=Mucilaginibacter sp. CSA2-8R TaxID=3141542 RepID=UPI00315D6397